MGSAEGCVSLATGLVPTPLHDSTHRDYMKGNLNMEIAIVGYGMCCINKRFKESQYKPSLKSLLFYTHYNPSSYSSLMMLICLMMEGSCTNFPASSNQASRRCNDKCSFHTYEANMHEQRTKMGKEGKRKQLVEWLACYWSW